MEGTRCEEHGRLWYYAASFAQWPPEVARGQDFWNCRTDLSLIHLVDWRGRAQRVDTGGGSYRNYRMPVWYTHALWIDWYVVGHQESIERMLATITHLGKKFAQGWGAVLRWEVERWPEDWSVRGPRGRLMRAVPSSAGAVAAGFRPSYWMPKNQAWCKVPSEALFE